MLPTIRLPRPAVRGMAVIALAMTLVAPLTPSPLAYAQATQTTNANVPCPDPGPPDYPIAGGWFYTQEGRGCITSIGPSRRRGYLVIDDGQAAFWTEFRRFGGTDVLGYPVSQRYHYPVTDVDGNWYQGFERGILKWHPETGRAELANVYEQFTEQGLDPDLEALGIPPPEPNSDAPFATDAERRMAWLTEPRFLARYFYDPVGAHSSDPQRAGQAAFTTQEQAWDFFGLPQGLPGQPFLVSGAGATRTPLPPLVHTFLAQRFQKGGMELFLEGSPNETFAPVGWAGSPLYLLDPTIVPGDGIKGCVALTAVGLLARTVGVDKLIPGAAIQALPIDPSPLPLVEPYIPPLASGQLLVQFQLKGSAFAPGEQVSVTMSDARPDPLKPVLPSVPVSTVATDLIGSWDEVVTARVGTYDLIALGATSGKRYEGIVDLNVPSASISATNATTCSDVGLPVQAANPAVGTTIPPVTVVTPAATVSPGTAAPARARLTD